MVTQRGVRAGIKALLWGVWGVAFAATIWGYPDDHTPRFILSLWSMGVYISIAGIVWGAILIARALWRLFEGPISRVQDWYEGLPK